MIKFIGGPASGIAFGLNVFETALFSILGMMTSVLIFSYLGTWIKSRWAAQFDQKKKALFSQKNRKLVSIWNKWGITGVAFLTPIIFSPIVGTMLAVSFRVSPKRILIYMFLSALFWGMTLSVILKTLESHLTAA